MRSVASIDERRRERRRAGRRLLLFRAGVAGGVVAVVAFIGWLFAFSPVLALAQLPHVEGTQSAVDPEAVDATVEEVVMAHAGTPLMRLPMGAMREQIEQSPYVAQAHLSRSWPSGVNVQIDPRLGAMVQADGDAYELLGPDGVALGPVTGPVAGLPTVSLSGFAAGAASELEREAGAVGSVWASLSPEVRDQVSLVSVGGADVVIQLSSGSQVLWGAPEGNAEKSQVLEVLLAATPASVYDVMDPARPSTR